MANAIAVSKRDIEGMRTFSRFETLHYAQAQPPRKFAVKFSRSNFQGMITPADNVRFTPESGHEYDARPWGRQ